MDELLKLAVSSPSAAFALAVIALAVTGAGALVFLLGLRKDLNGVGGKVGRVAELQGLVEQRVGRLEGDHKELAGEVHALKEDLPERFKNERHDFIDRHLQPLSLSVTADLADVKDEIKDLKRGRPS